MKLLCAFGFHDWHLKLTAKNDQIEYCSRCPKTRPYMVYMYI